MYKLLVIDDSLVQLQYILDCISSTDLPIESIETAQDGEEGLEIFERINPDIVITDVVMPRMDGVEMTKKAQEINPEAKFIFMSCHESFVYLKNAMDNNVISYILKPIDADDVKASVLKAVEDIEANKRYSSVNKILSESMGIFRENFLYRFLHSNHIDTDYLENTLKNLEFNKFSHFLAAAVELETSHIETEIYGLMNLIKTGILNQAEGYVIIESDKRCVITFMSDRADEIEFYADVKARLRAFAKQVKTNSNIAVNIGLSKVYHTLYEAKFMLSQALETLDSNLTSNDTGIFEFEENRYGQSNLDISELKSALTMVIDDVSPRRLNDFLNKYYSPDISKGHIKILSISIITILQLLLLERNMDISELFGNSSVVWNKIDHFETIQDNRTWLYNMLQTILQFIHENEDHRYKKIIQDIIDNINFNYSNISNVNQLMKDMYISTSYAQSIFKKYTGKSISDYVLTKRMEEAKKLLYDPYIKVYEVAEKVGFKSKAHFSETFKNYTGLTPKEFQQNH